MESPFLQDFLRNVGDSVHSINTIVVGLSSIETGNYIKPNDLTISWNTSDKELSARRARKFALKSSLLFIEDALSNYLKDIRVLIDNPILVSILTRINPQFESNLVDTFKVKYPITFKLYNNQNQKATSPTEKDREYIHISSVDRIRALDEFFKIEKKYWIPCVIMLIRWRNKIAHKQSVGRLTPEEIDILLQNKSEINNSHANIDISLTIAHFDKNELTLKDATTLIAITIRLARLIDEQIFKSVDKIEIIESYVMRKDLIKSYNSIVTIENEKIKKRKFANFVKTNICPLEGLDIDQLFLGIKAI